MRATFIAMRHRPKIALTINKEAEMADDHEVEIALLKKEVEQLNEKLDKLSTSVEKLVVAWQSAGALVAFVKTVAALVVAVTVIVGAFKFGGGK